MKLKRILSNAVVALILFFVKCSTESSKKEIKSKAIELNDRAMIIYSEAIFKPLDVSRDELNKANNLLKQAIEIDENFVLAYINRANVLIKLKEYEEAINLLQRASELKENFAEVISMQGFLYEKIGNLDSANKKYQQAIEAYNKRIADNSNNIEDKVSRSFMLIFIEDKNTALEEIKKLSEEYPENPLVREMEQTIRNFNREAYIKDL